MEQSTYENYPCHVMGVSNLVSWGIYLAGMFVFSRLGFVWVGLYVSYVLWLEFRVMENGCVDCYYFGKWCAFGKGKISSFFFKKKSKSFKDRKFSWKDLIPDMLVSIVPLITAVLLLISSFDWGLVAAIGLISLLTTVGNGFVRTNLACKYCKQREIGCPAEQLFKKK